MIFFQPEREIIFTMLEETAKVKEDLTQMKTTLLSLVVNFFELYT